MSSARVHSIAAIQEFAHQLQTFRVTLIRELESLDLELQRATFWIVEDARNYWVHEQQVVARKLAEQLQQLSRCMSYVRKDEQRPCTEEKKRVARSKERMLLCESKIRLVHSASVLWEAQVGKLMTRLQRCRDLADSDLLVAVNQIRQIIQQLERYVQARSDALNVNPQRTSPKSHSTDDPTHKNDDHHETT